MKFEYLFKKLDFLNDLHIVGGAIRDKIICERTNMSPEIKDIDFATSNKPQTVVNKAKDNGYSVVPKLGQNHGTVIITDGSDEYEITTFRKDLECDGRHAEVKFTDDIFEDLKRRDFTMNAMAMNKDGKVIDPHDGRKHIKWNSLIAVGNPYARFREDKLRIIRGFRFASKYDLNIQDATYDAMIKEAYNGVEALSVERIVDEMDKAFCNDNVRDFLSNLYAANILQHIIPEFENLHNVMQNPKHHPEGDVLTHIFNVVERSEPKPLDRWAALLHDIGKKVTAEPSDEGDWSTFHRHDYEGAKIVERICEDLKFSNDRTDALVKSTKLHMQPMYAENQGSPINKPQIRKFQDKAGEHLDLIQRLAEADHGRGDNDLFNELEEPIEPVLMGKHLIDRGHEPGPQFGPPLDAAKEIQIEESVTDVDELYNRVKHLLED